MHPAQQAGVTARWGALGCCGARPSRHAAGAGVVACRHGRAELDAQLEEVFGTSDLNSGKTLSLSEFMSCLHGKQVGRRARARGVRRRANAGCVRLPGCACRAGAGPASPWGRCCCLLLWCPGTAQRCERVVTRWSGCPRTPLQVKQLRTKVTAKTYKPNFENTGKPGSTIKAA